MVMVSRFTSALKLTLCLCSAANAFRVQVNRNGESRKHRYLSFVDQSKSIPSCQYSFSNPSRKTSFISMSMNEDASEVGDGVLDLVFGYVKTNVAYQFSKMCAADVLLDTDGSAAAFAVATGTDHDLSRRFLRAAVSVGLVREEEEEEEEQEEPPPPVFVPTDLGRSIGRAAAPGRGVVLLEASPEYARAWSYFDEVLRTGERGWEMAHGVPRIYDSIDERTGTMQPLFRDTFYDGLRSWGELEEGRILSSLDADDYRILSSLPPHSVIVDVGGGEGSLASRILVRRDDVRVILQDQPTTCDAARANPVLRPWIEQDRLRLVERSFFDTVVTDPKARLYVLKYILHNWSDDDCIRILNNVREAMNNYANNDDDDDDEARLLIIEHGPIQTTPEIRLLDLHMAVLCGKGATERTTEEYSSLVRASGLTVSEVISSMGVVYAIECKIDRQLE